jgi:hypothetical protein
MRQTALATIVAFSLTFLGGPLVQPVAAQAPAPSGVAIPVTGIGADGIFAGTFTLQRFSVVNGVITAVGTLVGTTTTWAGQMNSIVRTLAIPVNTAATQASCAILHLELGPLNLDLLGLVIDLNRVVLDISAVPGAGNLLGNLLCAVAGLLDGTSSAGNLARLLNRILGLLG